ncbi:hypothetical protein H5410_031355 [Solanum commersonii]|uniref:Uncharacterized protein n=1 Tax=Solanum commersonii TaxID=4109 RepID=A0A9J5YI62_SOLCO|nr:hypothetical protein H5410_031355 [Solanum commersonii]
MKGAVGASLNSFTKQYYTAQWSKTKDVEGKHETTMKQKKGESPIANTKPPMCFQLVREGGRKTKTTRLMA